MQNRSLMVAPEMNPYAAPAIPPEESRIDPAFQVISAMTPRQRVFHALTLVAMGVAFFLWHYRKGQIWEQPFDTLFPCALFLSPLVNFLTIRSREKGLYDYPLVREGEAKVAGIANPIHWRKEQGYLFLTGSELVFFHRGAGWEAGVEQRIPLAEIDQVVIPRKFGLAMQGIEVHFAGIAKRFGVYAPKRWVEAIDAARIELNRRGRRF